MAKEGQPDMNGDLVSGTSLEPGATTQGLFTSNLATEAALSVTGGSRADVGSGGRVASVEQHCRSSCLGRGGVWAARGLLSEGKTQSHVVRSVSRPAPLSAFKAAVRGGAGGEQRGRCVQRVGWRAERERVKDSCLETTPQGPVLQERGGDARGTLSVQGAWNPSVPSKGSVGGKEEVQPCWGALWRLQVSDR